MMQAENVKIHRALKDFYDELAEIYDNPIEFYRVYNCIKAIIVKLSKENGYELPKRLQKQPITRKNND